MNHTSRRRIRLLKMISYRNWLYIYCVVMALNKIKSAALVYAINHTGNWAETSTIPQSKTISNMRNLLILSIVCLLGKSWATLPHPRSFVNVISWQKCEIKFYGVKNFIYQNDNFYHDVRKRGYKTDKSLETMGKEIILRNWQFLRNNKM